VNLSLVWGLGTLWDNGMARARVVRDLERELSKTIIKLKGEMNYEW
jgi:hypothetical protein